MEPIAPKGTGPPGAEDEDVQEKSLRLLELDAIRERLAVYASFPPGRELALNLEPAFRREEVACRLAETTQGRYLLDHSPDLSLAGAQDVRPVVGRALRSGLLEGLELLAIADTLAAVRTLRRAVLRLRPRLPLLAPLAQRLPGNQALEREIRRCVDRRGEVTDKASPELYNARLAARSRYEQLHGALSRLVHSSLGQETLQEPIVTFRGDRLVVPVRADRRGRFPGLVHSVSDSGATLFMEPLATVEMGNQWREMQALEEREVEKVLRDLSEAVARNAEDIIAAVEVGARLDLVLARAHYSRAVAGIEPQLAPEDGPPEVALVDARHPLLAEPVVPITIDVGGQLPVLLITGPNMGGKTVALKTIGLLTLMAQAGLHIPAAQARLSVFQGIYADIGDEQSIEQAVSTFSSHLGNIVGILRRAGPGSLVLLDELGSSTDPEEGSSLAKAILRHLVDRGVTTVATTHHQGVAAFVQGEPGMRNASVELDPVTFAPTYRLRMGLPGRSYGLALARRLGLPEEVLQQARAMMGAPQARLEDLLSEVQQRHEELADRARELEEAQAEVNRLRAELHGHLEELEDRREELLEDARQDLAQRAEALAKRLRQAERALEQRVPAEVLRQARQEVKEARQEVRTPQWMPPPREAKSWRESLKDGDVVRVRGFQRPARVLAPPDRQGLVEVLLGSLRVKLALSRIEALERQNGGPKVALASPLARPPLASPELDLRGQWVEEALESLEVYLSDATLSGQDKVRIIHGKGTGALRQAVRDRLSRHPLVKHFAPAEPREGGDGATVVGLR